jgi:hypothetical protein
MDYGNEFLNKDSALYSFILAKAVGTGCLAIIDVLTQGVSTERVLLRPLLIALLVGYEGGVVALNRLAMEGIEDRWKDNGERTAAKVTYTLGADSLFCAIDLELSSKNNGLREDLDRFIFNNPVAAAVIRNPLNNAINNAGSFIINNPLLSAQAVENATSYSAIELPFVRGMRQTLTFGGALGLYGLLWYTNMS